MHGLQLHKVLSDSDTAPVEEKRIGRYTERMVFEVMKYDWKNKPNQALSNDSSLPLVVVSAAPWIV